MTHEKSLPYSNNPKWPRISIVTPSYNQGQYLEETILSVITQNYPNLEYIIIDGGSTDKSIEIIQKYEKHLAYWVSEPDTGQSDAINKGLSKCTGFFFNWLNSDDLLYQGSLHSLAKTIAGGDFDVICGFMQQFGDLRRPDHRMFVGQTTEATIINYRLNQPATFYRTAVVRHLGGLNTGLHYVMDMELWFHYLINCGITRIKLVDYTIAKFRYHQASKTMAQTELFSKEKNALIYSVAKASGLPDFILNDLITGRGEYLETVCWPSYRKKGLERLNSFYSRIYALLHYSQRDYGSARKAFINYLRTGAAYFDRSTMMIILRSFFQFRLLVYLYRKIKNILPIW